MKTFLQLVNKVEQDSGTVNTRSSATSDVAAAATLRQQKIVDWVKEAWNLIQTDRSDWRFMRAEFEHALVNGQARYTAAELGLTDLSRYVGPLTDGSDPFTVHDPALGAADQRPIRYQRWDEWLASWGRGAPPSNRPMYWTVDLAGKLCIGPAPDRAWVLTGEYVREPQELTASADVPRIPGQFHDLIAYRALMLLADHDEAVGALIPAKAKYDHLYRRLVNASTEPASL